MASLAEIRARLQEQDKTKFSGGDSAIYAFWNIPEGTTATLRFLPDGNTSNTFFWLERQMIRLPFSGVRGSDESRSINIQVPCVEMWGDACPILAEVRPWFKDKSLEDMGRKYWKKRSYIFQGFVVNNPLNEDETPENPIRRFIINTSIFNIIKGALMDPEMENIPTDYQNGTDFRLVKTTKGQYADYGTSSWARKERGLNEKELESISKHSLFDLNDFMPKHPSKSDLVLIKDMFEASVNGELFNQDKWGAFHRSNSSGAASSAVNSRADDNDDDAVVATKPAALHVVTEETAAKEEGKKTNVDDILKMIRNRQATK